MLSETYGIMNSMWRSISCPNESDVSDSVVRAKRLGNLDVDVQTTVLIVEWKWQAGEVLTRFGYTAGW